MNPEKNIITREDLREAVKRDTQYHEIKELAMLLIAAMTDWPTNRSDKMEGFVQQFKAFHTVNRRPLDQDRVKGNKFGMVSGIRPLASGSQRFYQTNDGNGGRRLWR
ncbi:MAG: hypothetical protein KDC75_13425 [Phaeodactylibacter sp.]|nr:hypothetical protein [Phaeodactylibacter sp.]